MAKDLTEHIKPMDFHPCDTPRGMTFYNLDVLTDDQKRKLSDFKIDTMRENEKYLAEHPEIRGFVSILSRLVLRRRPRKHISATIGEYFSKSRIDIEHDLDAYISSRGLHEYEAVSGIEIWPEHSKSYITVIEEEEEKFEDDLSISTETTQTPSFSDSYSFDIHSGILQAAIPDSMKNLGVDYTKLKKLSSGKLIQSISILTQTAESGGYSHSKVKITTPEKPTVQPKTVAYAVDEGEVEEEDEVESVYVGHIPTIEDYDAGYGHRRQTFDAPHAAMHSLILQYLSNQEEAHGRDNIEEENEEYLGLYLDNTDMLSELTDLDVTLRRPPSEESPTKLHQHHHLHLDEVVKHSGHSSIGLASQTPSTSKDYYSTDASKEFDSASQDLRPLTERNVDATSVRDSHFTDTPENHNLSPDTHINNDADAQKDKTGSSHVAQDTET